MLTTSTATNINWSVDPDVRTGWLSDIYTWQVVHTSNAKQKS